MTKTTILTDKARLQRLFDAKVAQSTDQNSDLIDTSAARQIRRYYASLHKTAVLSESVLSNLLHDHVRRSA